MKPAHRVIAAAIARTAPRPRLSGMQQAGLWLACMSAPLLLALASTYAHATNERTAATYRAEGIAAAARAARARAAARAEMRSRRVPTISESKPVKKPDTPIAYNR